MTKKLTKGLLALPIIGFASVAVAAPTDLSSAVLLGSTVIAQSTGGSAGGRAAGGVGTGSQSLSGQGGLTGQGGQSPNAQNSVGGQRATSNSVTGQNSRESGFTGQGMTSQSHQGGIENEARGSLGRSPKNTQQGRSTANTLGTGSNQQNREDIMQENQRPGQTGTEASTLD